MAYRYNNLGLLNSDEQNLKAAQEYYQLAVNVFQDSLPADHLDLATTRMNLGTAYYSQGKLQDADSLYRLSYEAFDKKLDSNHIQMAQVCANLGLVNMSMEKLNVAEPFLKRSIEVFEANDPNYPGIEPIYEAYSVLLFNTNQFDEAKKYRQKAGIAPEVIEPARETKSDGKK